MGSSVAILQICTSSFNCFSLLQRLMKPDESIRFMTIQWLTLALKRVSTASSNKGGMGARTFSCVKGAGDFQEAITLCIHMSRGYGVKVDHQRRNVFHHVIHPPTQCTLAEIINHSCRRKIFVPPIKTLRVDLSDFQQLDYTGNDGSSLQSCSGTETRLGFIFLGTCIILLKKI